MTRWRRALDLSTWINAGEEIHGVILARRQPRVVAEPAWHLDTNRDRLTNLLIRWPIRTRPEYSSRWLAPVRRALATQVRVVPAEIYQPVSSSIVFELVVDGRAHTCVIDTHDLSGVRDGELAARSLAYFKMQYDASGYALPQIVPGGYLADTPRFYSTLPYLRAVRDRRAYTCDVYARFGLRFSAELRTKALKLLQDQTAFSVTGGNGAVSRARFLKDIARSRICIDLPGQGDFCYRLVSALGIGSCIVGPRPKSDFPAALQNDKHVVWTKDDLGDLVEICDRLLEDSDKCERLATESRKYFDQHLHPASLAAYYLRTSLDRLRLRGH
jgi:Glycosyl transferases group 1